MKYRFCFLMTSILTAFSNISADVDSGDYGSEQMSTVSERSTPFKLDFRTDFIGEADTKNGFYRKEKLYYSESQADISGVFYYNACYKEALAAQIAYNVSQLYWKDNPLFDQRNFNNIGIAIGGVSQRLCGWTWQAYASLNMDSKNVGLNNYTTYDLLMWGKYNYNDNIGVHVGFLGWTGLKIDKILPILGFDWTINDRWTVNAVFPLNVSVVYSYNNQLSFTAAGRFFWNRHRIEKHALLPQGVWEYRNSGIELGANYSYSNFATLNVHAGYAFGGNVKLSNRNHKHTRKFEFDGSPYVGGELAIHF